MTQTAALPARGVIEIGGEDRVTFLQGLVSNDVATAAPGKAVWTALLTPQGKWLADFFILAGGAGLVEGAGSVESDSLLLDCERAQMAMLIPRLSRFRLRSKVTIAARDDLAVFVAWDGPPPPADIAAPDPRLPDAGCRLLSATPLITNATAADWDLHRLRLGLPDGSADMEAEKSVLLEAGFDELSGVAWDKGCYMGQELTARTKYRGLVKRRLVPVTVDGPLPASGTPVLRDGAEVGTMRSGVGRSGVGRSGLGPSDHEGPGRAGLGLAVLRLEALHSELTCGEARLTPHIPDWMRLPEPVQ
jgi:tRNA-modifying protein YgfZ